MGFRDIDFETVRQAYYDQAEAMADFVDFFLIETVFDTLNAKAAIQGAHGFAGCDRHGSADHDFRHNPPTAPGRTLSGQTAEAFWYSVRQARPWAVGLNCALGAEEMRPYIAEIARLADTRIIAYPMPACQ